MKTFFYRLLLLFVFTLSTIALATAQISNLSVLYTTENNLIGASEIKTFRQQSILIKSNFWLRDKTLPTRGEYFNATGFRLGGNYRFYFDEGQNNLGGAYAEIGGLMGWHQVDFREIEGGPDLFDAITTVFSIFGGKKYDPDVEPRTVTEVSEKIFVTGLHLGGGYRFVLADRLTLEFGLNVEKVSTNDLRSYRDRLPNTLNGWNTYLQAGCGVLF